MATKMSNIFKVVVLLHFLAICMASSVFRTTCYSSGYFEITDSHIMNGLSASEFEVVEEEISTAKLCLDRCMLTDWCVSINYRKANKTCQLNAEDKISMSAKFEEKNGWIYADLNMDIGDENYRGPCASYPCMNGGTCVVDCVNTTQFVCNCAGYYGGDRCESLKLYPVGLWPLTSAYVGTDATEYGNDGSMTGTSLANGPNGESNGAYYFSGSWASYMEISNGGALDTEYSMTVLMWIYPEGSDGPIFHYHPSGFGVHLWQLSNTNLYIRYDFRDGSEPSGFSAVGSLTQNAWNYVGTSYDYSSGIAKLWYDGEMVATADIGTKTLETNGNVRMGYQGSDGRYYRGRISCVQLYNRALTADEILSVKDCPIP